MPGEFEVICQTCGNTEAVTEFPKCPRCGHSAMLCEVHMRSHNCKRATREARELDQAAKRGRLD